MNIKNSNNTKTYQRGFGAAGALAVIVILGIVGFTGWFVYHSNKETNDTLSQTVGPDTKTPTTPVTDSAAPPPPSNAVQKITYSKAPKALQTAILAETMSASAACVKDGAIVDADGKATDQDVNYAANGFAETGIGCDGSAATIFAKAGSVWKKVGSTQFEYKCADLKQYNVPVAFVQAVSPDPTKPVECISADPNATAPETYKL